MSNIRIRITSADCSATVSRILTEHISLKNLKKIDRMMFEGDIDNHALEKLKNISFSCGEKIEICKKNKIRVTLKNRAILIIAACFMTWFTLWMPSRIFFVQVQGNQQIPVKQILEAAEQCGVHFGVNRRKLNSEKIKNAMLQQLPKLRWVGITSEGSVATVHIREGISSGSEDPKNPGVSSIVATRDGVVDEYISLRGTPLCKVGDRVKEGQTLISGYTDCGIVIKGERADGEVFARTNRHLTAFCPDPDHRGDTLQKKKRSYSIILGKKLIKFQKDSGIIGYRCVKMYKDYQVSLPGGFLLPMVFLCEETIEYSPDESVATGQGNPAWLKAQSNDYLLSQMVAGKVLDSRTDFYRVPGGYQMNGQYYCLEMIGKSRSEEIVK